MTATREVITLQFGPTASFVGATYTPRLVLCDWRPQTPAPTADHLGDVAEAAAAVALRQEHRVEMHALRPTGERSQFQRDAFDGNDDKNGDVSMMGDDVVEYPEAGFKTWTDCLGTRLHPRSLLYLPPAHAASARAMDAEEFESRVRLFAEECDALQGFQLLADAHDGVFGRAAATTALAYLGEEFPRRATLAFPCFDDPAAWLLAAAAAADTATSAGAAAAAYRLNSLLTLVALDSQASLTVPLSAASPATEPWLRAPQTSAAAAAAAGATAPVSAYLRTAAAAAWLDTATLPTRLRFNDSDVGDSAGGPDLWDIQRLVCHGGRRICCPSLRLLLLPSSSASSSLPQPPVALGPFGCGVGGDRLACLSVGRALPGSADAVERWLPAGDVRRHLHLPACAALPAKPPFPARRLLDLLDRDGDSGECRRLKSGDGLAAWSLLENSDRPADCLDRLAGCVEGLLRLGSFSGCGGGPQVEADDVREAASAARDIADRFRPDRGV